MLYITYMALLTKESSISDAKIVDDTFFLLSSYFRKHLLKLLLQILGDEYLKYFVGDRSPSPSLSLHPCMVSLKAVCRLYYEVANYNGFTFHPKCIQTG